MLVRTVRVELASRQTLTSWHQARPGGRRIARAHPNHSSVSGVSPGIGRRVDGCVGAPPGDNVAFPGPARGRDRP
jgi:hypothetical protein